ncbi:MAG TPA: Rid family hydrolase, partial [Candidatus Binatus sp.]|nr:Rid family hydrolase [Candidatus Binatus sp.]
MQAGEFIFLAQDARRVDGTLGRAHTAEQQTRESLLNLDIALHELGLSTVDVVSLSVFLADYRNATVVANTLQDRFHDHGPAVNFVGVCGLEGGCRVRMDAIATTSENRETISCADLPRSIGAGHHGVRVGNFYFLSGVDAANGRGHISAAHSIQMQTTEVLTRIEKLLGQQQLGLANLCRTFMYMPGTQHRPGYGEARKKIYRGVFSEDAFPPNSGIYIRSLGENILLRSMAIA